MIRQPGGMTGLIQRWSDKNKYGGDLRFLCRIVWPLIKHDQMGHDAYTCTEFPNSHPFPTKRPRNYQHVGQVFDDNDNPRMDDIDRFIRDKQVPPKCRKDPSWVYG